jgi:hypothetical protein
VECPCVSPTSLRGACSACWPSSPSGCASTPRRPPCAHSPRWRPSCGAYHELTERYRHTYQREQPFLTPAADARERQLNRQRQQACDDFVKLQGGLQAYMQALGKLAGDGSTIWKIRSRPSAAASRPGPTGAR